MRRRRYDTGACGCGSITCPACEPRLCVTPAGAGLRPHRGFLSPRMPEAKWLAVASPYTWPLWRHWVKPKQLKVETVAETYARQIGGKPNGYTWPLERLTPAERLVRGVKPGKSHAARFERRATRKEAA